MQVSCASLTFAEYQISSIRLSILQGNIVEEDVDAIITISSPNLKNSNGFGRYIQNKAGKSVQEECEKIIESEGFLTYGNARCTNAGDLPCEFIIHAIVPPWEDKQEDGRFLDCIKKCLILADEMKMSRISFPLLCAGIPGFPKEVCAMNMLRTMIEFAEEKKDTTIIEIRIINHDNPTVRLFEEELRLLLPAKKQLKKVNSTGFLKVSGYDKNRLDVLGSNKLSLFEERKGENEVKNN